MSNYDHSDSAVGTAPNCPVCRSSTGLRIVYGSPSPELQLDAKQGRVALGGCVNTAWELNGKEITFDPDWRCRECSHTWQDEANLISDEDRRALLSKYSHLLKNPQATDA